MNLWQFPTDGCQGCLEGFIDFTQCEGGFQNIEMILKSIGCYIDKAHNTT